MKRILLDPFLWIPVAGLSTLSLFLIGSTAPSLLVSQSLFFFFGLCLFFVCIHIQSHTWRQFSWGFYICSLLLLIVTFFGPEVRGATRWIEITTIRLQPSEILKPFVILIVAHFAAKKDSASFGSLMKLLLLCIPVLVLIFRQPDLGNVLVYSGFMFSILLLAGFPWKYFIIGIFSFLVLLPLGWSTLQDYQQQRIISYINPSADPIGAGYNALQAIIAVGSGQLTGLGLGRGTQSRLAFLPEYHTDFIFGALGEELGFMGGAVLLILYALLLFRIFTHSLTRSDTFRRYVCVGVSTQLFLQVFINIGMNMGLLPITGITLPLLSYGGSSILSTFIDLGLVYSVIAPLPLPLVIR